MKDFSWEDYIREWEQLWTDDPPEIKRHRTCEYDPPCVRPAYDVMVPLNPNLAPPGRPGRRACLQHALPMIDPIPRFNPPPERFTPNLFL